MLEKVLGDVASWCWSYLVAKSSHAGVDVDRLACVVHRPTACSHQMRRHGFLPCAILPIVQQRTVALYWRIRNPQAWIFAEALDYLGTSVIEFYIECIAFLLGYVYLTFGSIMACMRVSLVEPSFQTVMGRIPELEYMLSGVRGLLQLCPILSGNERYRPSRP
jgi:hypothetical protein